MMLALVVVAGSSMAQTSVTPYQGGTYSYKLSGILVNTEGTATIAYSIPTDVTIKNVVGSPVLTGSLQELTFDVQYNQNATVGAQSITVTVADGGGCTNFIRLDVTVTAQPTLALIIDGATDFTCQALKTSPNNNEDASVGAPNNTIAYTITPTITPAVGSNYDFHFVLDDYTLGATNLVLSLTGGGGVLTGNNALGWDVKGANGASVITATFSTTTGQPATPFTATISSAVLHVTAGGGTYNGSISTATDNVVTVTPTPTIGTFSF